METRVLKRKKKKRNQAIVNMVKEMRSQGLPLPKEQINQKLDEFDLHPMVREVLYNVVFRIGR